MKNCSTLKNITLLQNGGAAVVVVVVVKLMA